ncbi:MAG: translesion DNA synthesis-associated protein ImuA [Pseudomonas sp.]|uniref:translesion DNA synthesis-associated protein ImuA n=1 Tax=Pseudomonas abieticivorans TaxID=2931382 RepID=UPI0020C04878|nr:translesion DNA synthesis-associated protein ImuA [Pseudomonas sp. PIA16]MDE1167357.1 translesion DNA synthesis-associated protein ImuA [Pseudomonas sp.]
MGAVVSLDGLLDERRVWKGRAPAQPVSAQPTGHALLDRALPTAGWPAGALSEILIPSDGSGELRLLWPTLARLTQAGERIVLVGAPFIPYPQAWAAAGVDLRQVSLISASGTDALWAAEQCLRSGSCGAVLCWPKTVDDRALRRLQVAAETGQTLAFACRPQQAAHNPSPAALRIAIDVRPAQLRVLKCRGGLAPALPLAFAGGA